MAVNAEQNQLDAANQNTQQNVPNQPTSTGGGEGNASSGGAGASPSGRVANFSNGTQNGSTGSGRFTNLNNYLNANQGATDRLYQGIGNKIETTAQPEKDKAQTSATAVRDGIQNANTNLDRGQGYYNQMQGPAFNAQDFVSDQNRLTDYAKFQNGQAVDVNNLNNLNSNAQTDAMGVQDNYNQRAQQVGNEEGRFGLLKETFGQNQPSYSSGQQRLDNLFLQAGDGNGGKVAALQGDVRNDVNQATNQLGQLTGQATNDITNVGTNQTGLANNLSTLSNANESGFVDNLTGQVAGLNDARHAQVAADRTDLTKLVGRQGGTSDQFLSDVGLDRGQRTYGAFDGLTNLEQLANIGRDATGAQDVATQADANQYDALAKLAFGKVDPNGQYTMDDAQKKINGASTLDPAVAAILGANGTSTGKNMITDAGNLFNQYAKDTTLTGQGGAYTPEYGEIAINGTANANLAQLLAGQGASVATANTTNRGKFGDIGKTGIESYDFGNNPIDTQDDLFHRISQIRDSNTLSSGWGGVSKNYQVDPSQETRNIDSGIGLATGGLAGAGLVNQEDKALRDLYHSDNFKQATSALPGGALSNLIGAVGGGLFGSSSRKNENLEQTANFANFGKDAAYTGAQGASDENSLYRQALNALTQHGYFDKT